MKNEHTFNLGDRVTIFQMSPSKGLIIEGMAAIVEIMDMDERYIVRFDNDVDQYDKVSDVPTYERFVDVQGQADPETYVRTINNIIAKGL